MTIARNIFVAVGLFWLVIGVLSAVLTGKGVGPPMIFVSERTDTALYGGHPDDVLAANPELRTFRYVAIRILSGLLVVTGLLTAGLAWFGLRDASAWGLTALTVVGLAVLPFWWLSLAPYRDAEVAVRLGDTPPFMWVPAILMPVASVVAWIEYLRT